MYVFRDKENVTGGKSLLLPQMKDWTEKLSTGLDLSVAHYRFVSAFKLRASTDDKYLFQTTACTARGGGGARDTSTGVMWKFCF